MFKLKEGLSWASGERTRTEENMKPWMGQRAAQGNLPPVGFPRSNKFNG